MSICISYDERDLDDFFQTLIQHFVSTKKQWQFSCRASSWLHLRLGLFLPNTDSIFRKQEYTMSMLCRALSWLYFLLPPSSFGSKQGRYKLHRYDMYLPVPTIVDIVLYVIQALHRRAITVAEALKRRSMIADNV